MSGKQQPQQARRVEVCLAPLDCSSAWGSGDIQRDVRHSEHAYAGRQPTNGLHAPGEIDAAGAARS